jgi:hypothetical protein
MTYEKMKRELQRRIAMLKGVISDCEGDNEEFLALYHHVRDIQPFMCQVLAEQWEDERLNTAYLDRILTDEEQIQAGTYLYHKENPDEDENAE